jgi:hypothetical protein
MLISNLAAIFSTYDSEMCVSISHLDSGHDIPISSISYSFLEFSRGLLELSLSISSTCLNVYTFVTFEVRLTLDILEHT